MKLEIKKIALKQTAISLAGLSAVLSCIVSVFSLLLIVFGVNVDVTYNFLFTATATAIGSQILILLVMPILTFISTFITVLVIAFIYNITVNYTGGISFFVDSSDGNI